MLSAVDRVNSIDARRSWVWRGQELEQTPGLSSINYNPTLNDVHFMWSGKRSECFE